MLRTFRIGGIYLPENKLSAKKKIERLPLPEQVIIPLSQHIGVPAVPVVKKGEEVKVGTLLARSEGFVSAQVHSSVSGKVNRIDQVVDSDGYQRQAIFIDVENDTWDNSIDRSEELVKKNNFSSEEIIRKIDEAGIVGMGGSTFPTHAKLSPSPGAKAEVLLINGTESEPYLTSDHALMLEKSEEILVGITLLMKAIDVDKAVIGIENNKKDAIRRFSSFIENYPGISVVPLKVKYPQGGEKQLIDAILRRRVPGGALSVSMGVVVQNVATVFAVYEAVQKNKPLIERVVTVTGKKLSNPCNLWVRIGTPACDLIDFAGGLPDDTAKVINGGPMMGKALVNMKTPVAKGSSGILLLSSEETRPKEMRNCIRCAKCVNVCPMSLIPNFLMDIVKLQQWEKTGKLNITDCIECGACNYVCPANLPLVDYIRLGKSKVFEIERARKIEA